MFLISILHLIPCLLTYISYNWVVDKGSKCDEWIELTVEDRTDEEEMRAAGLLVSGGFDDELQAAKMYPPCSEDINGWDATS